MPGRFDLRQTATKQYFFILSSDAGEVIGKSEKYKAKASAKKGIRSVKKNILCKKNFTTPRKNTVGKWHFSLKAKNGGAIMHSNAYASQAEAHAGINAIIEAVNNAVEIDHS